MKEQIKKLAETAGFYFYDMRDVDGQDLGKSIEADDWTAAERFAELIVRECIYYAFCHGDDIGYVKRHFGVEE